MKSSIQVLSTSVQCSIAYLGKAMDHKVYCLPVVNLSYCLSPEYLTLLFLQKLALYSDWLGEVYIDTYIYNFFLFFFLI